MKPRIPFCSHELHRKLVFLAFTHSSTASVLLSFKHNKVWLNFPGAFGDLFFKRLKEEDSLGSLIFVVTVFVYRGINLSYVGFIGGSQFFQGKEEASDKVLRRRSIEWNRLVDHFRRINFEIYGSVWQKLSSEVVVIGYLLCSIGHRWSRILFALRLFLRLLLETYQTNGIVCGSVEWLVILGMALLLCCCDMQSRRTIWLYIVN